MVTLPFKSSRNEQHAVIHFLWAKGLIANEIHFEMRPVYGDKCFFGLMKKMLCGQKFTSDTEVQSFVSGLDSSQHCSLHWAFRSLLTDGTNV